MSNYFNVGETVIIQSDTYPENNGQEATVLEAVNSKKGDVVARLEIEGRGVRIKSQCSGYSYRLDLPTSHTTKKSRTSYDNHWYRESSLRKKHEGSDESYSEIMKGYTTTA